jgi:O-acetyl-ADP-ribose deacetylase (regulator of RNase III)
MIKLVHGDITQQEADALVNAANSSLVRGGGVDGAIHRVGGPKIIAECQQIRQLEGGCPPGKAVITGGGNLKAKYVIHAVGPIWRDGTGDEAQILASAYQASLELALQYECETIAVPSLSTGAYGFPLPLAAKIAITTTRKFLAINPLPKEVRFVLFDQFAFDEFERNLNEARALNN